MHQFKVTDNGVSFEVEGNGSSQITMELEPATDYKLIISDVTVGNIRSTVSGKLSFSVDCAKEAQTVEIKKVK